MQPEPVFYPQARIAAKRSAKTAMLARFLLLSSWITILLGIVSLCLLAFFVLNNSCTAAWIAGAVALLMLAQVPVLAALGALLEQQSRKAALQEKDLMNTACLHGEVPWGTHSLGYRF